MYPSMALGTREDSLPTKGIGVCIGAGTSTEPYKMEKIHPVTKTLEAIHFLIEAAQKMVPVYHRMSNDNVLKRM